MLGNRQCKSVRIYFVVRYLSPNVKEADSFGECLHGVVGPRGSDARRCSQYNEAPDQTLNGFDFPQKPKALDLGLDVRIAFGKISVGKNTEAQEVEISGCHPAKQTGLIILQPLAEGDGNFLV